MRILERTLCSLVVVAVASSACSSEPNGLGPYDATAQVRPEVIVVDPAEVDAGGLVAVFFPDERTRGILYVLESRSGDTWNLDYYLMSGVAGGAEPQSFAAERNGGIGADDIAFSGPGPEFVVVPVDADPGEYRICTGNTSPSICALLMVGSDP